ncbi:MAG TPA: DUF3883 domain-containing protein [Edaphocola sp.]|nr:DUF3883 domain-containing protein [Edaphocola sp.]
MRDSLLCEAVSSPNLLSDLAGLEKYIAESYNNRSFIELLQNADDAGAHKFKILKEGDLLFVANDGRAFNQQDLESLCRSASSNKLRGQTIGYRGIGFKSVVGFAKEIYLFSEGIELVFSKERTKQQIPQAKQVPLIRIPHRLTTEDKNRFYNFKSKIETEGYNTIFVFTDVIAEQIESEFESFKHNALLFLKNVELTEFVLPDSQVTEITKQKITDSLTKIKLKKNNEYSSWIVTNYNHTGIAFYENDNEVKSIDREEALIHAFLPTEDATGLGVLINGNFSTDPSRRHLIFDEETITTIKQCASHLTKLYKEAILASDEIKIRLIEALTPYSDPRMFKFSKKSFEKYLFEEIKSNERSFFSSIKLPPHWLNSNDFLKLVSNSTHSMDRRLLNNEGFLGLLKYLGAQTAKFEDIKDSINNREISILGCTQIANFLFKSLLTHNAINISEIPTYKIIMSDGIRKSINDLNNLSVLDDNFMSLLYENGLTESDILQVLKIFSLNIRLNSTSQKSEQTDLSEKDKKEEFPVLEWFKKTDKKNNSASATLSSKRWRSAEEQTLIILNQNGFILEDVSKQNIGYDLEGIDPTGNKIQIEVKSITLPGQKFKMTNNEIAVAQANQKSFFIAVVRQTNDFFEIALIRDPINTLSLNRQCIQWIWECESYEYKPIKFQLR